MDRTRYQPEDEDEDEYDPSGDYDAYRDYDPDDPETYPEGLYADDGPPLVPCPYCREEIAEDAERCPECGNYLSREDEDRPAERKSATWVVLLVLVLLIVAFWVVGG
jgi:hypothetical protein